MKRCGRAMRVGLVVLGMLGGAGGEARAAGEKPTFTVMPFVIQPAVRGRISMEAGEVLTERFAAELTRQGVFRLMDSEFLETARARGSSAGAQKLVRGMIGYVGETYTLQTRIVDVKSGVVETQVATDSQGPVDELLTRGLQANAEALVRAWQEKKTPVPEEAEAPAETP